MDHIWKHAMFWVKTLARNLCLVISPCVQVGRRLVPGAGNIMGCIVPPSLLPPVLEENKKEKRRGLVQ